MTRNYKETGGVTVRYVKRLSEAVCTHEELEFNAVGFPTGNWVPCGWKAVSEGTDGLSMARLKRMHPLRRLHPLHRMMLRPALMWMERMERTCGNQSRSVSAAGRPVPSDAQRTAAARRDREIRAVQRSGGQGDAQGTASPVPRRAAVPPVQAPHVPVARPRPRPRGGPRHRRHAQRRRAAGTQPMQPAGRRAAARPPPQARTTPAPDHPGSDPPGAADPPVVTVESAAAQEGRRSTPAIRSTEQVVCLRFLRWSGWSASAGTREGELSLSVQQAPCHLDVDAGRVHRAAHLGRSESRYTMTDLIYRTWAAGRCPCCQAELSDWVDGTPPGAIGEGVLICGRCVANEHMLREGEEAGREAFLKAIAIRDDAPFEDLL